MSPGPTVSVLTTSYNAEAYIADAVHSILAQRGIDVEQIVVDDGSTDRTTEVVRAIGDPRVRLLEPGRVGRGRALNLGLAACRADYVGIQDADDLSHPGRLAVEMRLMADRPELAAVGSGQVLVSTAALPDWKAIAERPAVHEVGRELFFYNPLSHSSVLFRRAAIESVGGYDERRRALFDWDLYVRLASQGQRLAKLSVPLIGKRVHSEQFFEGRRRFRYAIECFRLQWDARRALRLSPWLSLALPLLLVYRLIPRGARLLVRRRVTSRRAAMVRR